MVTVIANARASPAASANGALHEKGRAAGAGAQASGGTMAVIGAGAAAPETNMLSVKRTPPLKGSVPLLVIMTSNVQSMPGKQDAGAALVTVISVPPSSQAIPELGAPRDAQLRKPRLPVPNKGPVSTKTVTERELPAGSEPGGSAQANPAVGVGVHSQSRPSGDADVMVTLPPAPGPARMVEKSENVSGPEGEAMPTLVTVITQRMVPPMGPG
jgi:hypothetical protein